MKLVNYRWLVLGMWSICTAGAMRSWPAGLADSEWLVPCITGTVLMVQHKALKIQGDFEQCWSSAELFSDVWRVGVRYNTCIFHGFLIIDEYFLYFFVSLAPFRKLLGLKQIYGSRGAGRPGQVRRGAIQGQRKEQEQGKEQGKASWLILLSSG